MGRWEELLLLLLLLLLQCRGDGNIYVKKWRREKKK